MSTTYKLVNPYVKGSFDTNFQAESQLEAAKNCWKNLSSHFTNTVPKFAFTLERLTDGKYFHFTVNEKVNSGIVRYKINQVSLKNDEDDKILKSKIKSLETREQEGGKHHRHHKHHLYDDDDDSSSSSSSDSDSETDFFKMVRKYKHKNVPFYWWWYSPLPYQFDTFFIPTFTAPLSPYVEIQTSNWYLI